MRACPGVRPTHYLLSPTHTGFGNQMFGVEKALWLALALNRTLILPPLLTHGGKLSFNVYPRCKHDGDFEDAALAVYGHCSQRWTSLVNFSRVVRAGGRVVDYSDVPESNYTRAKLTCGMTRGWRTKRLRENVPDTRYLLVGSSLRMELDALRREFQRSPCGWAYLGAAHVLPFTGHVRVLAKRLLPERPFLAVHLRSGDVENEQAEAVVAAVVTKLLPKLKKATAIYLSYDLSASFRHFSDFLHASCPTCPPPLALDDLLRQGNTSLFDDVVRRHGTEFARIALDQEIAAHATEVLLSDGAYHSFRKKSSFGRLIRRRWDVYRRRAPVV